MKKIKTIILSAAAISLMVSCKDYLDINDNPNQALNATPQSILAGALSTTANNIYNTANSYGAWTVGYWGKSGDVNGYAPERTYNYTTSFYQGLWADIYDNLNDYKAVENAANKAGLSNHEAIALIMEAYNFQALIDQYGDVPYNDAFKGADVLTPKYDKAEDVYKTLIANLTKAVDLIKNNPSATVPKTEDIMFYDAGLKMSDLTKWVKFANTLKLRMLMRISGVPSLASFASSEIGKMGSVEGTYLSTDALVNPGYIQSASKQNPFWNRYNQTPTGTTSTEATYVRPTSYAIDQYELNNDPRIAKFYNKAGNNYVGVVLGGDPLPASGASSSFGPGIFKGYNASSVIMLAAESNFLQAEAISRGYLTGDAKDKYTKGIQASFLYLGLTLADANGYITANAGNPQVDFAAAANPIEIIIYQKYLALNSLESNEALSEYRRTGFPADVPLSVDPLRVGSGIPTRLLYPLSEISTNSANVPKATQWNKIFWDVN
ncbi:SusD/RagB family nutrient-binding outer membrane lipoprotein [Solitalea sp. MAHUQ-68]|uniref:SusD/RagB family nutrient-binding outer membrane lipoprotein n=1 Tax=Solitalea agri TaxID=2953739 RepID=A0A9X2FAN4_9SPHI|nr:SusD/RagB family nutrient-binding outer membrane lipoprotein [Solitalea agri]MCO4293443.1 SusD/RagB family nutrient-binding outer membrane lipoprotein [Solitalea agri]